jgi:hypothetical protein
MMFLKTSMYKALIAVHAVAGISVKPCIIDIAE